MAEHKKCKKCKKSDEDCKCPKKGKLGYYGLEDQDDEDDATMDPEVGTGSSDGGMSEGVRMPKPDNPSTVQKMGGREKRKSLADFQSAVSAAKKRQSDQDRKDELYMERKKKGIKFYDAKGSGYIRDGKKHYD